MSSEVRRFRRQAARAAALGGLATFAVAVTAHAIPAGGGAQLDSARPEATSAVVVQQELNTAGAESLISVCFDQAIRNEAIAAGNFSLVGPNENDELTPDAAARETSGGNLQCVRLTFSSAANRYVQGGSLVEIAGDSVHQDLGPGLGNTPASVRLEGSDVTATPGDVAGPNLRTATIDTTNQTILYTFDKAIDPASIDGGDSALFRYQTTSNDPQRSGSGTPALVGEDGVRVAFAGGAACANPCNVGDARRFIVERNAVETFTSAAFDDNNVTNVVAAAGGAPPNATLPTLLSATKVPATRATWDLKYSTNVEANTEANGLESCVAFLEDGSIVRQRQAPGRPAPDTLRVTFGIASASDGASSTDSLGTERKSDDKIVLIADDPPVGGRSCARESAAAAQDSAKASVPAQGNAPVAPGFVDSPDLTSCFYQQGQEGAVFVFDRRQDVARADVARFGLVNPDGSFITVVPGTAAIPLQDDRAVQVQLSPAQTADAVGCFVQGGAVRDFQDTVENSGTNVIPKTGETNAVAGNQAPTQPGAAGGTAGTTGTTGTTTTTGGTSAVGPACRRARGGVRRQRRALRRRKAAVRGATSRFRRNRTAQNARRIIRQKAKLRRAKRGLRRARARVRSAC